MSNFELPPKIESYLAVLASTLKLEGNQLLLSILANASPRLKEHQDEDFGGDFIGHDLYLTIPHVLYVNVLKDKDNIQSEMASRINSIKSVPNEYIAHVIFDPAINANDADWRQETGAVIPGGRIVENKAQDRIWQQDYFRVFLSHKTQVKKETASLKEALELFGVSCFVAHEDIVPTKEWQNEIENALFSMDALVALMTDDFHDSPWTDQEVGAAMGRGVPIIPVTLESVVPYGFIGKYQALRCSWQDAPVEIAKLLVVQEKMKDAYINALMRCLSFESGYRLAEILPSITGLSDIQVTSLIRAYNENSQIGGCYAFNGKDHRRRPPHSNLLIDHLKRITGRDFNVEPNGWRII